MPAVIPRTGYKYFMGNVLWNLEFISSISKNKKKIEEN